VTDDTGNVFVTGFVTNNAFKVTPGGVITEIIDATGDGLGNGLKYPQGIALDDSGNVFVTSFDNGDINFAGAFKVHAGGGVSKIIGYWGADSTDRLVGAISAATDDSGNVFIAGVNSHTVWKVTPAGVISNIMNIDGDGVHRLISPYSVAVDDSGNVFVPSYGYNPTDETGVFKVTPAGVITRIIGPSGDGNGNTLGQAYAVATDTAGNVFVAGYESDNVFKITPGGVITEIADATGDGLGNPLLEPHRLTTDVSGNVYVTGRLSLNAFKIVDSLDLVITDLYIKPDTSVISPTTEDEVQAIFKIKNFGVTPSGSFDWRLLVNGVEHTKETSASLGRREVLTDTVSLGLLTSGSYVIRIEADPDAAKPESDETNNADSLAFLVKEPPILPDLVIDSLFILPDTSATSPTIFDRVSVNFIIANHGEAASGEFIWAFSFGGGEFKRDTLASLAPGETMQDSVVLGSVAPYTFAIEIEADPENIILESDETNNTESGFLSVKELDFKFDGHVVLEGPHTTGGIMAADLGAEIPLTQPYSNAVFDGTALHYDGSESVVSLPPGIVDWVLVDLRTDSAALSAVPGALRPAFIDSAGSILGLDGDTLAFAGIARAPYYYVVRHRNHLSIMTPDPVAITDGVATWDFTTSIGQAYSNGGAPMKDLGSGIFGMFACDANADGQMTALDFVLWIDATSAGEAGYLQADCNMDVQTTALDFIQWIANTTAGASAQVRE
jgi:hypothetical protein